MKEPSDISPLRRQAIDALKRAREVPPGPYRNDLRQIAIGLRWLERRRLEAAEARHETADLSPLME